MFLTDLTDVAFHDNISQCRKSRKELVKKKTRKAIRKLQQTFTAK